MTSEFPIIEAEPKSGQETFTLNAKPTSDKLVDFWSWIASDLISNANRGILAEFLVARALGLNTPVRTEWDPYDLITPEGLKIEVKSSAYVQSWHQERLSTISFSIKPTKALDPETNKYDSEAKRQADVYVFCLLDCKDQSIIDPMNLNQWRFFVLPTVVLNRERPGGIQISLNSLLRLNPYECKYDGLRETIDQLAEHPLK